MWRAAALAAGVLSAVTAGPRREPARPVVVVLVPMATWPDIARPVATWAKANVSVGPATNARDTVDAYLSIGAGHSTGSGGGPAGVGALIRSDGDVAISGWADLVEHNRSLREGGPLGRLGQTLARRGLPRVAIGPDSQIAAALADEAGNLPDYREGGALDVADALAGGAWVVAVETTPSELDGVLAAASGRCRLVVTASSPPRSTHLGAFAASPECGLGRAGVSSTSTDRRGIVTYADVGATVLALSGSGTAPALRPASGGAPTVRALIDADVRSRVAMRAESPFVLVFGVAAFALVVLSRRSRAHTFALAFALALPSACFLVMLAPWWRAGVAGGVGALVACATAVAAIALVATRGAAARAAMVLVAFIVLVTAADAARGGALQFDAPMMNNAIIGGRFHGMGNVASAFMLGACVVVAAVVVVHGRRVARAALVVGLVAIVVLDGAPPYGADFGGVLASVPAFGLLLLSSAGYRLRRLLLVAGATVVAGGAFVAADLLRAPSRQTHVARALHGHVVDTILRREKAMVQSFSSSPWTVVACIAIVGLATVPRHVRREPVVRVALPALGLAIVLGTVLNDSGVAVAGATLAIAWPAIAAATWPPAAAVVEAPSPATTRWRDANPGRMSRSR